MLEQDNLNRLAELAGIEPGWWDFFGTYREVSAETRRRLLAAMGFAVETDAQVADSLAELEDRPWRRWLEPVYVANKRYGNPWIPMAVPVEREADELGWAVVEEGGKTHKGTMVPARFGVSEERVVDGATKRRRHWQLPIDLPPGRHTLILNDRFGEHHASLLVCPARAYVPEVAQNGKLWGFATQLYALRGADDQPADWGMGDFGILGRFAKGTAAAGAQAVGVNPLHALFSALPDRFSPYSPSSRVFVNVAYLDVEAIPEFAASIEAKRLWASPGFRQRLATARGQRLVDYPLVASLKLPVLEAIWRTFKQHDDSERMASFRHFQKARGRSLDLFATFEALLEHFAKQDPAKGYWRNWPAEYADPEGPAVARFAGDHRERVDFFAWLQFLADEQLAGVQKTCADAGMSVGLYADLAVGIGDDGADTWMNQALMCPGASVGAPPDPLAPQGQDWGLVPFNPIALREAGYKPLLDVLEANMRHAGALRLDHAMNLQRLYWVPRGMTADQGTYVRYPVDDLFSLVCLESVRNRCLVIGEDLGTVPDGFRERMAEAGIFGYRLLVFEQDAGGFKAPSRIDQHALVMPGTHDLPSLRGWWAGTDVEWRNKLAVYPRPEMGDEEWLARAADRRKLLTALQAEGLLPDDFPVQAELSDGQAEMLVAAAHEYVDRTPSRLMMVQVEDVLALSLQMNLPGTTDQHPNWRVRLPIDVDAFAQDRRLHVLANKLNRTRGVRKG